MPQIISLTVAALFFSTALWSMDETSANKFRPNGVILKQQCLMTVDGEYPNKCNWVFVGEAVRVQSFQPKRPLNRLAGNAGDLVLVRTDRLSGLVSRSDVLSVKGITRQENNATPVQSWSGAKKFEVFIGDAWGTYEFKGDGRYVFRSGGDGSSEPPNSGRLYRAGRLLFVDHSLIGPTFLLITLDKKICWFAGNESQCTK